MNGPVAGLSRDRLWMRLFWLAIALLAAAALLALVEPAYWVFRRIPLGYNEGWNAYWAEVAWRGGQLYPPVNSPIANNYPPVSFCIVGALGRVLGDAIYAGRLLALLSTIAVTANLWIWLRAGGFSQSTAVFGALLFLAAFVYYAADYVGTDDPQMMAHAFVLTGAAVLWRSGFSRGAVVTASLLMIIGVLTKQLLLPLPFAITFWMFAFRRERFGDWLRVSVMAAAAALLVIWLAFGTVFFTDLLASRVFSWGRVASSAQGVWEGFGFLIVLGMAALLPLADGMRTKGLREAGVRQAAGALQEYAALALLYMGFAAGMGLLAAGGKGVEGNAFFDLLMATSLAVATAIEYLQTRTAHAGHHGASLACVAVVGGFCGGFFVSHEVGQWPSRWRLIQTTAAQEAETARAVLTLRALGHGAVACETLSLCYWAGSDFKVDFFTYGQKLFKRVLPPRDCERVFSPASVPLVQVEAPEGDSRMSRRLPLECNATIALRYEPVATYSFGVLLRPRPR